MLGLALISFDLSVQGITWSSCSLSFTHTHLLSVKGGISILGLSPNAHLAFDRVDIKQHWLVVKNAVQIWMQEISVDGREIILHSGQLGGYNSRAIITRNRVSSLLELDVFKTY